MLLFMELSIVIPAFNEEKRLPPTLDRVITYLSVHHNGGYEIIVVNDGSQDKTAEMVESYRNICAQIKLLSFNKNRGYGAAVREGCLFAKGDFVLAMDADGSVHEEAIIRFLKYLKSNPEISMAVGSRTVEGAKIVTPQPWLRVFLGNMFLLTARILFAWPMEDRINGFKMFRKDAIKDVFLRQFEDGVLGAAEIVYVLERRGWKYDLLPVLWTDYRDSKINPLRESYRSLIGMIKIILRDRRGTYTT